VVCLASGVVLGLGTNYGLVRYWWVAIKLALNVVLVVLVVFALRPGVIEMAEQGWRFIAGEPASLAVGGLIFPPIVSTSALLVATVLAVFKPWGRIRKRQSSKPDAR
jgi:ABC-type phosphate transport system permease subunit